MKNNIIVVSLKKNLLPAIFLLFTIFLVIFSRSNLAAAKNGLSLWANSVVPALFPFFIATELLSCTNIVPLIGKLFKKIMRPLFNVPGEGAFAFLMGVISGYPTGAKIVSKFREENIVTKEEGERLLAFTNNSGPLFIIATVGISLFGDTATGFLLFFTHVLACISVGIVFRFWKRNPKKDKKSKVISTTSSSMQTKTVSFSNLGSLLANAIMKSIDTIVMIGGFVVIFSVIISILNQSHVLDFIGKCISPFFELIGIDRSFSKPFSSGILELTNGVKEISKIATKDLSLSISLCAFLIGFGGISVLLQVFSITSKSDVSIKAYFIGKLLHGFFAFIYTYLITKFIPIFNLDLSVFSNISTGVSANTSSFSFSPYYIIFLLVVIGLFGSYRIREMIKKEI